ncbi:hypothetical protein RUM43_006190 [Polyplax serrata]|uniref:Uncharacterized protein n=1 Tax=Polyplax serrata TaxID=468196 RepID=A0AAN8PAV6_POLSC
MNKPKDSDWGEGPTRTPLPIVSLAPASSWMFVSSSVVESSRDIRCHKPDPKECLELIRINTISITEVFRGTSDSDLQEWSAAFLDVKPQVILHDRLMTDAALGTVPIKTEHSYSLNSDGDSSPDSPISLDRIDEMARLQTRSGTISFPLIEPEVFRFQTPAKSACVYLVFGVRSWMFSMIVGINFLSSCTST